MQPHSSAVQTLTEPYNAYTNEDIRQLAFLFYLVSWSVALRPQKLYTY